ncbi:2-oxo-4-hydroxy-4-carboxy-5-ureidoimidazoline decarboxylase [Opitutus sp. GAS368]|uniref:2-oxo-4-hydroxy-4-carboxy-5-ureidoimidazoline decarboxylase n=1 Tax=Opitutus sp. GAS368 TaxID=1882749 RepID=UPI00087BE353|nr:2-oxo-4-hydroxy-4-carboxy-5-ureidoimidazoline decarboxylase [Opitutus sp. GAS368]SDS15695.1 2-oxo-4-hydroxy-4-carboxy-5-ureidoimidazoline decarboxylase [Opitutus sp. GAS368]
MPSLDYLNQADRAAFTAALGHLFEHSPWVAEQGWLRRPFASAEALHAALCAAMRAAPADKQRALIRAHPDLAGRLAQQKKLTAESTREQASAGLDQLTDTELAEFTRLNDAYKVKFGFPFIICARLNAKAAILAAMSARLPHTPAVERDTALAEIEKIAWLRLQDVLKRN